MLGIFVTFEGIEGCGKSTQIALLADALERSGIPFSVTREPGGSKIGAHIRSILLNTVNHDITARTELLLYEADRAQHVEQMIVPSLEKGEVVLCDRFSDATLAYQGFGRGLDTKIIEELNVVATGGLKPDITFFIDCPVEVGLERAIKRSASENTSEMRFEMEKISFHKRVREGYIHIMRSDPDRVIQINGDRDMNEVHRDIFRILFELLNRKNYKRRQG